MKNQVISLNEKIRDKIYIDYDSGSLMYETYNYKEIESISLKIVRKKREFVTFDWLYKHIDADTLIQYLKDRGMTACPLNK